MTFLVVVVLLITIIFEVRNNNYFVWNTIAPIKEPTLNLRALSGLSFVGIGKLLYVLRFYRILYIFFVVILRNKGLYNDFKKLIWYALMFVTGFIVVPSIIDFINDILSFLYNIFRYIVYISPSFLLSVFIVSLTASVVYLIVLRRH